MLKSSLHQYVHCLIVHHFNRKTPDKTVNRMSLVVLDIECIESNIVKELGVYKDGQTLGYSFLPPKKFKPTSQSFLVYTASLWNQLEQWLRKIY